MRTGSKQEYSGWIRLVIEQKGAVCREVVEQMAAGVQRGPGNTTAIATSGIAGPEGGSDEKPVGTTWICVQYGDKSYAKNICLVDHGSES